MGVTHIFFFMDFYDKVRIELSHVSKKHTLYRWVELKTPIIDPDAFWEEFLDLLEAHLNANEKEIVGGLI
jgi:hypothetical protein